MLAIVSPAEHVRALKKRLGADPSVVIFPESDALKAVDTITAARPKLVVITHAFATTPRGATLVSQLRKEFGRDGLDVRVFIEDPDMVPLVLMNEADSVEKALVDTSRPLERAGTRAAVRFVMDRRRIVVNGEPAELLDLSVTGAQVLVGARVRPNEPARLVLSKESGDARFHGIFVWSVAVPMGRAIYYRAGIQLSNPDPEWIEDYYHRYGGRPDRTFGA
jgi:hypothetical protein